MNPALTYAAQPDGLAFTSSVSLSSASDIRAREMDAYLTHGLLDPSTMYPPRFDTFCSDFPVASFLDSDTVPRTGDLDVGMFSSKPSEVSWEEPEVSEPVIEDMVSYIKSPEFFMHIVLSAVDQDKGATTADIAANASYHTSVSSARSSCGPSHSMAGSTTASRVAPTNGLFAYNPMPSLGYPDDSDSEEHLHFGDHALLMSNIDSTNFSPASPLCYPPTEELVTVSPALSNNSASYSPFSPVPSLYYPNSVEAESPPQFDAVGYQSPHVNYNPSPQPVMEESILSKAARAAGATYMPSGLPKQSKHPQARRLPYPSSSSRALPSPPGPPARKRTSPLPQDRDSQESLSPRPRNVQSPLDPASAAFTYTDGAFRCPVPGCGYEPPATRRKSDIRRHLETHRSTENQQRWVCCGVPVGHAEEYGITDVSGAYMWRGWLMVGGCKRGFSRRDSLGRHFKSSTGCRGHMDMAELLTEINDKALAEADDQELGY